MLKAEETVRSLLKESLSQRQTHLKIPSSKEDHTQEKTVMSPLKESRSQQRTHLEILSSGESCEPQWTKAALCAPDEDRDRRWQEEMGYMVGVIKENLRINVKAIQIEAVGNCLPLALSNGLFGIGVYHGTGDEIREAVVRHARGDPRVTIEDETTIQLSRWLELLNDEQKTVQEWCDHHSGDCVECDSVFIAVFVSLFGTPVMVVTTNRHIIPYGVGPYVEQATAEILVGFQVGSRHYCSFERIETRVEYDEVAAN